MGENSVQYSASLNFKMYLQILKHIMYVYQLMYVSVHTYTYIQS